MFLADVKFERIWCSGRITFYFELFVGYSVKREDWVWESWVLVSFFGLVIIFVWSFVFLVLRCEWWI